MRTQSNPLSLYRTLLSSTVRVYLRIEDERREKMSGEGVCVRVRVVVWMRVADV